MSSELLWTVCDNSGIKLVKQLKIKSTKCKVAKPGDIMVVFPRKFNYVKSVKRQKYLALVTSVCYKIKRYNGHSIKANLNNVVLLNPQKKFVGSKVFGPVFKEVRSRRNSYIYKRIYARTSYFI